MHTNEIWDEEEDILWLRGGEVDGLFRVDKLYRVAPSPSDNTGFGHDLQ